MADAHKPHAVCIAYPHQSHIKATMNLAKLLHHKGFFITFVNTDFNHKRLLRSKGPSFLEGSPDFRFETIPDGLPPSDSDSSQDASALCESITHNFLSPFRNLLVKLNDNPSTENPPVTCIVADGLMSFTFAAAEEFGIPVASIFTLAACGVMGYYKLRSLFENGQVPLKGTVINSMVSCIMYTDVNVVAPISTTEVSPTIFIILCNLEGSKGSIRHQKARTTSFKQ